MKNVTKAAIAVAVMLAAGVLWVGYCVLHGDADIPPVPDPALDTQDISISVGEAKIDARLYQKRGVTPSAGLLWMHGGAFAGGSMNMPEGDAVAQSFAHAGVLVRARRSAATACASGTTYATASAIRTASRTRTLMAVPGVPPSSTCTAVAGSWATRIAETH